MCRYKIEVVISSILYIILFFLFCCTIIIMINIISIISSFFSAIVTFHFLCLNKQLFVICVLCLVCSCSHSLWILTFYIHFFLFYNIYCESVNIIFLFWYSFHFNPFLTLSIFSTLLFYPFFFFFLHFQKEYILLFSNNLCFVCYVLLYDLNLIYFIEWILLTFIYFHFLM